MRTKDDIVIPLNEDQGVSEKIITVPNMLSLMRILIIPFFIWNYLNEKYETAGILIVISGLSDFLDGRIARKFGLITRIGKILDPVSDKLTQAAMLLVLMTKHSMMVPVIILFVLKEGFMGIMGGMLLRSGRMLNGALWCGKICTAVLYMVLIVLILIPTFSTQAANVLLAICLVFMGYSIIRYSQMYWRIWHT